jgi:hypothetical protein
VVFKTYDHWPTEVLHRQCPFISEKSVAMDQRRNWWVGWNRPLFHRDNTVFPTDVLYFSMTIEELEYRYMPSWFTSRLQGLQNILGLWLSFLGCYVLDGLFGINAFDFNIVLVICTFYSHELISPIRRSFIIPMDIGECDGVPEAREMIRIDTVEVSRQCKLVGVWQSGAPYSPR